MSRCSGRFSDILVGDFQAPPLGAEDAPNRVAVAAIVVAAGRVDIARICAEVVHGAVIAPSRGPPVAVGTLIDRRATVEIAGQGQGKGIAVISYISLIASRARRAIDLIG